MLVEKLTKFENNSPAIVENMNSTELCDHLKDCFDALENASDSVLPMIELVCSRIIACSEYDEKRLTTIFAQYSKLIFEMILPNLNQYNVKSLLLLIKNNYSRINRNSSTLSIQTKAELVDDMSLNVSCDFLKECFEAFKQSSSNTRSLIVPAIDTVCGRLIVFSNPVEEQMCTILVDYSPMIADEILPNWEQEDIEHLHILLVKNYPMIILDFPTLSIETKTALISKMNLIEAVKFLKECFYSFKRSVKYERRLIVPIIELVCDCLIDCPVASDENQLPTIFAEYSKLIADVILQNWKQDEIRNLYTVLAKNYARIIIDFPTLDIGTKHVIVKEMNLIESCSFLKYCFDSFTDSSKDLREVIVSTIEYVSEVVIANSDGVEREFTAVFEQYSDLIADEILPNWKQNDIKNFHILLAASYPTIIDFATLSNETKTKIVEIIKPTALCDFLKDCFQAFENLKHSILPTIESVCHRIIDHPDIIKNLIPVFAQYSKLIADEILPKFDQSDVKSLNTLLKKTCSRAVANFPIRLENLQQKLKQKNEPIKLTIDRKNVLDSSFYFTRLLSVEQWRSRFNIKFRNELGVDYGGLLREWFTITTRAMLNPDNGFFTTAPGDDNSYMINKSSEAHLGYFKFFGRFLAKGIIEGKHTNCHLTKSLYKHILGVPVEYSDFQNEDPTYFKSLDFLVNNPMKDSGLDLIFTVEVEEFGKVEERELLPDGKNIEVTDENKKEYARLVSHMKMTESIKPQLDAFLGGFHDIIPKYEIQNFDERELEIMLCGPSKIDLDDLKANTIYNDYQVKDKVIRWFWKALRSFKNDDRAKFLMFTTGSFKAPLYGFATLQGNNGVSKFSIHKETAGKNRLPRAHTCFNQLDLPQYDSYEKLREKLLFAIREGTEGFGIV